MSFFILRYVATRMQTNARLMDDDEVDNDQDLSGFDPETEFVPEPSTHTPLLIDRPETEIADELQKLAGDETAFRRLVILCLRADVILPIVFYLNGICRSSIPNTEKQQTFQRVLTVVLGLDHDAISADQRRFCDYLYKLGRQLEIKPNELADIKPRQLQHSGASVSVQRIETQEGYFAGYSITGPREHMVLQEDIFKIALHYGHGAQKPSRDTVDTQVAAHIDKALKDLKLDPAKRLEIKTFLTSLVRDNLTTESGKGSHFLGRSSINLGDEATLKRLIRVLGMSAADDMMSVSTYRTARTTASVFGLLHLPANAQTVQKTHLAAAAASSSAPVKYIDEKETQSNKDKETTRKEIALASRLNTLPVSIPDTLDALQEIQSTITAIHVYPSAPHTKALTDAITAFSERTGKNLPAYMDAFYEKHQQLTDAARKKRAAEKHVQEIEEAKQSIAKKKAKFATSALCCVSEIFPETTGALKTFFDVCFSEWFYSVHVQDAEETLKEKTGLHDADLLRMYHRLAQPNSGIGSYRDRFNLFFQGQKATIEKIILDVFGPKGGYNANDSLYPFLLKLLWDKWAPDPQIHMKQMSEKLGLTPGALAFEVALWKVAEPHYKSSKTPISDFFQDMGRPLGLGCVIGIINFGMHPDGQIQQGTLHGNFKVLHWQRTADGTQTGTLDSPLTGTVIQRWTKHPDGTQKGATAHVNHGAYTIQEWAQDLKGTQYGVTSVFADGTRVDGWELDPDGTQRGKMLYSSKEMKVKGWTQHPNGTHSGETAYYLDEDIRIEGWTQDLNGTQRGTAYLKDGTRVERWSRIV